MTKLAVTVLIAATLCASLPVAAVDYCDSEVRTVTPGAPTPTGNTLPSDAIVLFDGTNLSQWKGKSGPALWDVKDGVMTVKKGSGDIETRQSFRDVQLHLEWRIPKGIAGEGQHRGNSGVFLQSRYEIQILDSYNSRTYADGQAGSIYGQVRPLVNAMRPPGEWNTYDIIFTAPRFFDDGTVLSPARITVLHNGVLIQNNTEILGATGAWGRPGYYQAPGTGPIRLQDHPGLGDPVSYRNIWVREISKATPAAPHSAHEALQIIPTKTIQELLADPVARAVLYRCVPELVPDPAILEYVGAKRLDQLKGELDITMTDTKLQLIDAQLEQALKNSATSAQPFGSQRRP